MEWISFLVALCLCIRVKCEVRRDFLVFFISFLFDFVFPLNKCFYQFVSNFLKSIFGFCVIPVTYIAMSSTEKRLCRINVRRFTVNCSDLMYVKDIHKEILSTSGIPSNHYYLVKNGKKLDDIEIVNGLLHFLPRLVGGKGGFGSMLRAIGAQIEKTTNREACRDLSGRRLRDINEEQRLKNWIAQQAEREREAAERKRKKLERLCKEPKHDFKDETYEKERSELTEKISSSVEEGFKKAGTSGNPLKRPHSVPDPGKKKKKKLLIDVDDDLSSSDSEVEASTTNSSTVSKIEEKASTSTE